MRYDATEARWILFKLIRKKVKQIKRRRERKRDREREGEREREGWGE